MWVYRLRGPEVSPAERPRGNERAARARARTQITSRVTDLRRLNRRTAAIVADAFAEKNHSECTGRQSGTRSKDTVRESVPLTSQLDNHSDQRIRNVWLLVDVKRKYFSSSLRLNKYHKNRMKNIEIKKVL